MAKKLESFKINGRTITNIKKEKNIKDKEIIYDYSYSFEIKNTKGRIVRKHNGKPERIWMNANNLDEVKKDIKGWINSIN